VTVISSNQDNVNNAIKRLNSPHASGKVGDVRDEQVFIEVLRSIAPVITSYFLALTKLSEASSKS
jgi:hypothetical protein